MIIECCVKEFKCGAKLTDTFPMAFTELEQMARKSLDGERFRYISGSAGTGDSLRANLQAFQAWRIVPRVLKGEPRPDPSIRLLGKHIPLPIVLAPAGAQGYIHRQGELGSARAAATLRIPFVLSSYSTRSPEEVSHVMGESPRWLQLYPCLDEEIMASFVNRAESGGFSALVITVDKAGTYWHYDGPHTLEYDKYGTGLYFTDPVFRRKLGGPPEKKMEEAFRLWHSIREASSYSWKDIDQLRSSTRLPLLLKGLLHPDDVELALSHSVDGIILSNHGGRRLDGAVAALDILQESVDKIHGKIPLLVDGGIRSGTDVLKALALGANAVLVGRGYLYGLAVAGEQGVVRVVSNLGRELAEAMAICGVSRIDEINAALLRRVKDGP
jgi:lactate 2-monooxygenase